MKKLRTYPLKLKLELIFNDDCKILLSKGHQDQHAFLKACEEWNGGPLEGWGNVRYEWMRKVPDGSGIYSNLVIPSEPHARGAFPATTILDNKAYDRTD